MAAAVADRALNGVGHLVVEAMKVVHPGQKGEAVVTTPVNRKRRKPRVNVPPDAAGRALLVQRIRLRRAFGPLLPETRNS